MSAPSTTTLLHVTTAAAWGAASSQVALRPASLDTQGFVHLCTEAQLPGVLSRFFAGARDLVLLRVDASALPQDELRWEEADVPGERFPHLYAPLPCAAVVAVEPLA